MKEDKARYFAGLMEDFLNIPAFVCENIERKLIDDKYEEVINYVIDRKLELEQRRKTMSKGLEALKTLKERAIHDEYLFRKDTNREKAISFLNEINNLVDIIEKELKRLEELEKAFDTLSKDDEKAKKLLSKEIEKNRAFEIIKKKQVNCYDIINSVDYKHYLVLMKNYDKSWLLTQEEYELLKEVLL